MTRSNKRFRFFFIFGGFFLRNGIWTSWSTSFNLSVIYTTDQSCKFLNLSTTSEVSKSVPNNAKCCALFARFSPTNSGSFIFLILYSIFLFFSHSSRYFNVNSRPIRAHGIPNNSMIATFLPVIVHFFLKKFDHHDQHRNKKNGTCQLVNFIQNISISSSNSSNNL